MNFTKLLFIVLTLVMLCGGGCSTVSLGYNNADWLLRYWITDFTSFNEQQKENICLEVANYVRWHRKNALPEYTVFLQNLNALIYRDAVLNAADVMRLRAEITGLYKKTMAPFIKPSAYLLNTLDSRQIQELHNTLTKKNRKEERETLFASEQENLIKRAENHIRLIEQLVGSLSSEQKIEITRHSLLIPFTTKYYIEQREEKQARLIALLNNKEGEDKIAILFLQWVNTPEAFRSPQQQQAIVAYENAMNEMIVRIFELLTAQQKDYLSKKISSYIDDFQKLTKKG